MGGPIRGSSAGKRLIEPSEHLAKEYFQEIPEEFKIREGMLLIVPSYHIFGSEELSSRSASISELATVPFMAVNPEQVNDVKVTEEGTVEVAFPNISYHLPVKVLPSVPKGLALIPMGLDGLQWNGLPFWLEMHA